MTLYQIYQQPGWYLVGLFMLIFWTLLWTGIGLWHSAKEQQKGWFIAIFLFNVLGILSIIYILWFRPPAPMQVTLPQKKRSRKTTASERQG